MRLIINNVMSVREKQCDDFIVVEFIDGTTASIPSSYIETVATIREV